MLITSFVFMACEKESITKTDKTESGVNKIAGVPNDCKPYWTELDQDKGEWCTTSGENCAPCVTIEGNALLEFEGAIELGTGGVGDFFNDEDNWKDLFPFLADEDHNDFLNALCSYNYEIEEYEQESGKVVWKAYDPEDEEADVYGLTTYYDGE